MPPPLPPAPMAKAGMPRESGRLASVEPMRESVLMLRWRSTARRLREIGEDSGREPEGRLPMRETWRWRSVWASTVDWRDLRAASSVRSS